MALVMLYIESNDLLTFKIATYYKTLQKTIPSFSSESFCSSIELSDDSVDLF